jgi:small subunit ribosomal protein S15e
VFEGRRNMADAAALKKKRTFRKFTYRGVDLDQLLDMTTEQLMELFPARARRRCALPILLFLY